MRGTSPFIFALHYLLIKFARRHPPPPTPTASLSRYIHTSLPRYFHLTMNFMQPAQVSCPGCERVFTPHGFSQHLSRIEDHRCCRVLEKSQTQSTSTTFPRIASQPTLSSTWASQISGALALGDLNEYNEPTQGEFAATHVAVRAAISQKFSR